MITDNFRLRSGVGSHGEMARRRIVVCCASVSALVVSIVTFGLYTRASFERQPAMAHAAFAGMAAHNSTEAMLLADADGQALTNFFINPAFVVGGETATVTLTLRKPASKSVVISLTNPAPAFVRLPASITIHANQSSASFLASTARVERLTSFDVSASLDNAVHFERITLAPAARREWHVAPQGTSRGSGTAAAPWDLATALAGGAGDSRINPGDHVWLHGGNYTGAYTSTLAGNADAPVIVRQYPGERATIDRAGVSEAKTPALKVKGAWVWFWGFEVMNSHTDRRRTNPYTAKVDPWRGSGADVYAPHVRFINMIFHDNGHGIWDKQDATEIHGCLFYFNGTNKREHALYTGNAAGTKRITDNIAFAQGGYGILAHSDSASSAQKGLHIEGNIAFDNGALTLDDQATGNLQVGGVSGVAAERITLKNNYIYNSPHAAAAKSSGVRLGYEAMNNKDASVLDNYIVAKNPLRLWWWQNVEFAGNTIYSQDEPIEIRIPSGTAASGYRWNHNRYFADRQDNSTLLIDGLPYDLLRRREALGFDLHSASLASSTALRQQEPHVIIRPNRYEAGRAHIVVYNWNRRSQITVDINALIAIGESYELRDAQNYFGDIISSGTHDGSALNIPMTSARIASPVGNVERTPAHTSPEFAVFVITRTSSTVQRAGND